MSTLTAAEIARRWLELYNDGTPEFYGSDRFLELFHEDVDWQEIATGEIAGRSGTLKELREAVKSGQAAFRDRHVEMHEVVEQGTRAVMRYHWSGKVAIDGWILPLGSTMHLEVAQFITVRDGRIARSVELCCRLPST